MKLASLAGRVRRMKERLRQNPRMWYFLVEQGRELPEHIRAQLAPEDTLLIREIPAGWLDDMPEGYHLCWIT